MSSGIPYHSAWVMDAVADLIWMSMEEGAKVARARFALPPRRGVGATLRPGEHTLLWNALVDRAQPLLAVYGQKAVLGRELGLSRQRIHDYFVSRTRMPDAERTLQILIWVIQQESPAELARRGAQRARERAEGKGEVSPNG